MWAALLILACGGAPRTSTSPSDTPLARVTAPAPTEAAAVAPTALPAVGPLAGARPVTPVAWSGTVEEVVAAGPYVYLHVERDGARRWVGTLGFDAAPGQQVQVRPLAELDRYVSPRAGRAFDDLLLAWVSVLSEG